MPKVTHRRDWLRGLAAGVIAPSAARTVWGAKPTPISLPGERIALPGISPGKASGKRLKVAALITRLRHRDHGHVILENFVEPYLFNGLLTDSGCDIVSMYVEQRPVGDLTDKFAAAYGITPYPTIAKALCRGGSRLAVDAVLSIAEQGDYPINAAGQMLYPRKRFFDEIVQVFTESQRAVPVFNDKHFSYRWDWALTMVETARAMRIPFMAGSSVPLAQRRPARALPRDARITEAVTIHAGPRESYDFHGFELLQSFVEAREGGETGVASVQFLEGEPLWRALENGGWAIPLADASLRADPTSENPPPTFRELALSVASNKAFHGILVQYRSGLRAWVLRMGRGGTRWTFACNLAGAPSPFATGFYVGPWRNRNLFSALSHAVQTFFHTGRSPYPLERTVLTTGMLLQAMQSHALGGTRIPTPELALSYAPRDFSAMREMGATWEILTPLIPEPFGVNRRPQG